MKKKATLILPSAFTLGCNNSAPQATISHTQKPVSLMVDTSLAQVAEDYKVAAISRTELTVAERDGQRMMFAQDQVCVEVTNREQLDKILKKHRFEVVEQQFIPSKSDLSVGEYKQRYLLRAIGLMDDKLEGAVARAAELGLSGEIRFSSHVSLALFDRLNKLKQETDLGLITAGTNDLAAQNYGTLEGANYGYQSSGMVTTPSYEFWFTSRANGYYGASFQRNAGQNLYNNSSVFAGGGDNVIVAVIDDGFMGSGESRIPVTIAKKQPTTYNAINNTTTINGASASHAPWHGRAVSSLIFAPSSDGKGTVGVAENAIPFLIKTDYYTWNNTKAIDTAVSWGAKVINMSFGSPNAIGNNAWDYGAIKRAYDNGVILVASAGNDNYAFKWYPAAYAEVIGVGASNKYGGRWYTNSSTESNYYDVDIWAPGDDIAVAPPFPQSADTFVAGDGTSLASPIVAGAAAILAARGQVRNTDEAWMHLRNTADTFPIGSEVNYFNDKKGLNIWRAVTGTNP